MKYDPHRAKLCLIAEILGISISETSLPTAEEVTEELFTMALLMEDATRRCGLAEHKAWVAWMRARWEAL